MADKATREPSVRKAREEAEGTELHESPEPGSPLEHLREEAQGAEVFEDPDATLPAKVLKEGAPGHETLTGDAVGNGREEDEERDEGSVEEW